VHAKREHPFVGSENRMRAVALMDVEIDDRRSLDFVVALERANRNRDVVEYAEPLSMRREGVMCAPGEVHRDAMLQRAARRLVGSPRGTVSALDESGRPGKPQSSLLIGREGTGRESIDVVRAVDEQQVIARDAGRVVHEFRPYDTLGDHRLTKECVFGDRKSVAVG
jgi:hypothetical protein